MFKRATLIILSLVILVMSWEGSLEASGIIPDDSIRIRILANSDSVADQWIKREVRDAIIAETRSWTRELTSQDIQSARQIILNHIDDIRAIAEQTLIQHGYYYGAKVELGNVDFPAKQFGNRIYPENQYEALRITLGQGDGANWWCVLFPPLCFVDGTTVSGGYPQVDVNKKTNNKFESVNEKKNNNNDKKTAKQQDKNDAQKEKVKPKLYIVELWKSWF